MKANPTPLPRPPNKEILKHEILRKIEGKLFSIKRELKAEGKMTDQEIADFIKEERKKLQDEAENTPNNDPSAKRRDQPAIEHEKHDREYQVQKRDRRDDHHQHESRRRRDEGHTALLNKQLQMEKLTDAFRIDRKGDGQRAHKIGEAFDFDL